MAVEGRKLTFKVSLHDEKGPVGGGTHERFELAPKVTERARTLTEENYSSSVCSVCSNRPSPTGQKVSRAKLAYLIDATAAPVCIIAPVSSWAAAVTSSVPEGSGINGFTMFLRTIPYNYYAILTMVMSLFLIFSGFDYGPMKKHEDNALLGDLFTTDDRPYGDDVDDGSDTRGHVVDLIAPVLVLIAACIFGMVYTGGFFEGVDFVTAFANCSASVWAS